MKQKRYWLRGGICLGILNIILAVGSIATPACGDLLAILFELPGIPFLFLFSVITEAIGWHVSVRIMECQVLFLFGTLGYFLIGAVIGWIYGKIKNRNKVAM